MTKNKTKAARRAWKKDGVFGEDPGPDPDNILLEPGAAGLEESGPADSIGLQEIALAELTEMDDAEKRELLVNPSDLQDIGDPETGDVGVPGGFAAGGEMSEGGRDHAGADPWGSELMSPAVNYREIDSVGGTGSIESEIGEMEDERLRREE